MGYHFKVGKRKFFSLLLIHICFGLHSKSQTKNSYDQPNIIFILADDLRYDAIGANGNQLAITPNLDKLAKFGFNFSNAYVTSSICVISRASILSGQYERRHQIDDFSKGFSDSAFQYTYPNLLRKSGYYVGFIGKYGLGGRLPVDSFDYWKGFSGHGSYFYIDSTGTPVHETALMGEQVKEFIRHRDRTKPFLINVSFKAPHSEDGISENNGFRPDPYFNSWYRNVVFPYPETYDSTFYYKFPDAWRYDHNGKENEARIRWKIRFSSFEKYQKSTKAIYQLVSGIDKVVGDLLKFLDEQQLTENTILIFTSDNGYYMGEHGLEGKWFGHEESIHIPFIIYYPTKKPKRQYYSQFALNVDIAPTILDYAGLPIPDRMQGKSLLSYIEKNIPDRRKEFFYEHRYNPGIYPVYIPQTIGLISKKFKYMSYYRQNEKEGMIYQELFNLKNDPYEKENLANNSNYLQLIKKIKEKIDKYCQDLK